LARVLGLGEGTGTQSNPDNRVPEAPRHGGRAKLTD
jgi:hypothetical protein